MVNTSPAEEANPARLCGIFRPDLEFQESVNAACYLQLFPSPFEQYFSDVPQFAPLLIGELLKLAAQVLPDAETELRFPFTHFSLRPLG
jgi:hypothetical protein